MAARSSRFGGVADASIIVASITSVAVVAVGGAQILTSRSGDKRADKARQEERDQEAARRQEDRDEQARIRAEEQVTEARASARSKMAQFDERRRQALIRFVSAAEFCYAEISRRRAYSNVVGDIDQSDWRELSQALAEVRLLCPESFGDRGGNIIESLTEAAATGTGQARLTELHDARRYIDDIVAGGLQLTDDRNPMTKFLED